MQSVKQPVVPPVYRPQPVLKVSQTKNAPAQPSQAGRLPLKPVAPPRNSPQPPPAALQAKSLKKPETKNAVQASASNRQSAPVRPQGTVGNAPKVKRSNPGSGVIQRFYVEDADGNITWKSYWSEWDANKYVKSQNQPYYLFTVYKLKPTTVPVVTSSVAPTSSAMKTPTPVLSNKEKFKKLSAIIKQMQKASGKSVYKWAKYGEFKNIESYVTTVEAQLKKDESYPIKDTVEKMLNAATQLKSEFDSWKPGKEEVKEGFVYRPHLPSHAYASILPPTTTGTATPGSSKTTTTTTAVTAPVIVAKPKKTAVDWLINWGWTVGSKGKRAYYKKSYSRKGKLHAVHISLTLKSDHYINLITEATASGIWNGQDVHITMEEYAGGSKNNPRIWYRNGWKKSAAPSDPLWGDDWLMWLASDITVSAGFKGTITI